MNETAEGGGKSLYLDADVWLNLLQGEMLGFVPAFQRAKLLLARIEAERWELVVSDLVKKEVCGKGVEEEDMEREVADLKRKGLVENAAIKDVDRRKAGEIQEDRGLHFSDALHAAIAAREGSQLVTRNLRHFSAVSDLLDVCEPEEILAGADPLLDRL